MDCGSQNTRRGFVRGALAAAALAAAGAGGWLGRVAAAYPAACAPFLPLLLAGVCFLLPFPLRRAGAASRRLIDRLLFSVIAWAAAAAAIKLAAGALSPRWLWPTWALLALAGAALGRRVPRPPRGDLAGAWGPLAAGAACLLAFTLLVHRPDRIEDDLYLPDVEYGRLARVEFHAAPDCQVRFDSPARPGGWRRLPPRGLTLQVLNRAAKPRAVTLCLLVRNRSPRERVAALARRGEEIARVRLLARYDPNKHSRNYHKMRSNCGVLAATVRARPGAESFVLRIAGDGSADALSLCNLSRRAVMRELRRRVRFGDLADLRETLELSASMTRRLWPYTADYDKGALAGGGYTSVEPPLQHHLNSLAMGLLGAASLRAMAWMYVAELLLLYAACALAARRLAGRLSWAAALALAGAFMAYTTFVRPGVEGPSPDTAFLLFFVVGLFLLAAPERAQPGDSTRLGLTIALATLTQYYATPLFCLAAAAQGAVFRRWRRAAGWALFSVAVGLGVLALRVAAAWATGSVAALYADLRDQNLTRYFGLAAEALLQGRVWLLPYLAANYAHLLLACACAAGLTLLALPRTRGREEAFLALSALLVFLFIGVCGLQRSHYVAPVAAPAAVAAAIRLDRGAGRSRRRRRVFGIALAAACAAICLAAGRDYTGRGERFAFWCRSSNMARMRYFLSEGLRAAQEGRFEAAKRSLFRAVLADPEPAVRGVAWTALAEERLAAGDLAAAERYARRAFESDTLCCDALVVLARVAWERGQDAAAEALLHRALDMDSRFALALTTLADILRTRRPDLARYYRNKAQRQPTNGPTPRRGEEGAETP